MARATTVLPAEFAEIKLGSPLVMARKGWRAEQAFFDGQGKMVIDPQEELCPALLGRPAAHARQGRPGQAALRGYADAKRQLVLVYSLDEAGPFVDGLAVVGLADAWGTPKYGVIDRSGKLVVPAQHAKLLAPAGGLVRANRPSARTACSTARAATSRHQASISSASPAKASCASGGHGGFRRPWPAR